MCFTPRWRLRHRSALKSSPAAQRSPRLPTITATRTRACSCFRDDPIVERLLAARKGGNHADYERAAFGRCLGDAFEVERRASLASDTRLLYLAHPRGRRAAA
jgi:hypothetical protein